MITRPGVLFSLFLLLVQGTTSHSTYAMCDSDTREFHFHVDYFAGELGYFRVDECGDEHNPTLQMEVGETYTFYQEGRTNYYHPLGFAYFPDGAHDDQNELEPGVSEGSSGCEKTSTCPAPMYFLSSKGYLGVYNNDPMQGNVTKGEEDFGLDGYEPLFFHPMRDWVSYGKFSIKLRFDDETYKDDIFYFCHIHQFMTGRIKLVKDGVILNKKDVPPLEYEYDDPSEFDQGCGTFGLDDFQLPHPQCPDTYVCGAEEESEDIQSYAECNNAMNCHMFAGMTTGVRAGSPVALFIHQMIPHHQNAVNMAKALLKTGKVLCDDIMDEDDPLCNMRVILREIINNQNYQIQQMRNILDSEGYPPEDKCVVEITETSIE